MAHSLAENAAASDSAENGSEGTKFNRAPTYQDATDEIMADLMDAVNQKDDDEDPEEGKPWPLSSPYFDTLVTGLIILSALQMGVEADYPSWEQAWLVTENFFTAAFLGEMVLKMCILRLAYFSERWNWFDCILVCLSIADVWVISPLGGAIDMQSVSLLRLIRVARLGRLLRIIRHFDRLLLIMLGIMDALRATFWVGALILVSIYVCAIFCTTFIGRGKPELYPGYTTDDEEIDQNEVISNFNPYMSFGSMSRSMLTLFNILTGAEWAEVVRPVSLKEPQYIAFFLAFAVIVTYGVMNVIIAMVVDSVIQNAHALEVRTQEKLSKAKLQQLAKMTQLVNDFDKDGRLSLEDMSNSLRIPGLLETFKKVNLPPHIQAHELIALLDSDGDGSLSWAEITCGLYRLISSDGFQRECMTHIAINRVLRELNKSRAENRRFYAMMETCFEELRRGVGDATSLGSIPRTQSEHQSGMTSANASTTGTSHSLVDQLPLLTETTKPEPSVGKATWVHGGTASANIESIAAMSARIEAQIAQMLEHSITKDPLSPSFAVNCGSTVRQEVAAHLSKVQKELEAKMSSVWQQQQQQQREKLDPGEKQVWGQNSAQDRKVPGELASVGPGRENRLNLKYKV